jgi:hypothetical protein
MLNEKAAVVGSVLGFAKCDKINLFERWVYVSNYAPALKKPSALYIKFVADSPSIDRYIIFQTSQSSLYI